MSEAIPTVPIEVKINGEACRDKVEPRTLLVDFIRQQACLTGTHVGCETTYCGACTVLLNGRSVKSCTVFAVQADQGEVQTVEGLEQDGQLHPLQKAFSREHALQCGYCTPGLLMSALHLLQRNPCPSQSEIRKGIAGNLCRCTGYQNIISAIEKAAQEMGGRKTAEE